MWHAVARASGRRWRGGCVQWAGVPYHSTFALSLHQQHARGLKVRRLRQLVHHLLARRRQRLRALLCL